MKNMILAVTFSSLSLFSAASAARAKVPIEINSEVLNTQQSTNGESNTLLTQNDIDALTENVASLVQQQHLPEAIELWHRIVDAAAASAGQGGPGLSMPEKSPAIEYAIALRERAMLHRLNGNVEAALIDIEHACSVDARNDLAKPSGQYNLIERVFDSALGALQTRAQSGHEPEQPLLAALNSERIGEAFAAYGTFATAEFFYRNAFNLRLKSQGAAHAKTIQTAWRVIELTQMAGIKFTREEREDIILDTNVKIDNEPAAGIAPEGSKLKSMVVSPHQGALVFTASEPVLRGQRQYEDSFCGSEDVLGMPFADENEPDNITYLKPNADGTLELQLLVRDGKDNPNYRFSNVRPGATTLASLEGNCALPRVKVRYSPSHSKLCLNVRQTNQPVVNIVRDLISVTGISVQGIELLGASRVSLNMEIPAHTVLAFVADVAELELETIDETHFAFHPLVAQQDFSTPEKLAAALQTAQSEGDIDGVLALGNFKDTGPVVKWLFLSNVATCSYETYCFVSVKADDPAAIAERVARQLKQGYEFQAQPEGTLVISVLDRKTGAFQAEIAMPYALIDGQYRMLSAQYTAKKLTELRAQSNAQLLDALFAQGIRDNVPPHEIRFDWKTAATVLPPGGGELGAAYEAIVARDFLRYSTGDLAAVLADAADVVQDPVAKRIRVLALRTEAVSMLKSIRVLGGYQLGDTVVFDTLGKAENGWIVRGAVILTRNSKGKFIRSGDRVVSYPN